MRRLALPAAVLAGAMALTTGCGGSDGGAGRPELTVGSPYMPQPVSDMAAGFLTVVNEGGAKDELTSVSSDIAGSVTVHETVGQSMRQADSLTVPAHGRLVLESRGGHLMFEKLTRKLQQGEKVTVELHFATSGPITVEMPVKAATYRPATGH